MMATPGKIVHMKRYMQPVDCSGLTWPSPRGYGTISPSDQDVSILVNPDPSTKTGRTLGADFQCKDGRTYFVIAEMKLEGAPYSNGQKWHMRQLVRKLSIGCKHDGGGAAIGLVCRHNVLEPADPIPAHAALVEHVIGKSGVSPSELEGLTLKEAVGGLLKLWGVYE